MWDFEISKGIFPIYPNKLKFQIIPLIDITCVIDSWKMLVKEGDYSKILRLVMNAFLSKIESEFSFELSCRTAQFSLVFVI